MADEAGAKKRGAKKRRGKEKEGKELPFPTAFSDMLSPDLSPPPTFASAYASRDIACHDNPCIHPHDSSYSIPHSSPSLDHA